MAMLATYIMRYVPTRSDTMLTQCKHPGYPRGELRTSSVETTMSQICAYGAGAGSAAAARVMNMEDADGAETGSRRKRRIRSGKYYCYLTTY